MSIFAEMGCRFLQGSIQVLYSLIHHITCRFEARQALIYQLASGLTGENGKYNYSKAVHLYPPFFDIFCSPKNYKTASALTGAHLGIPWRYYEKMLQEEPSLLAHNVNHWLHRGEPAQRMLRTLDGKARAFLSNRYRPIDNLEITAAVLPIIGEMQGARFESCSLTENYLYLKVVNPRLTGEVRLGDVVQAGIVISNSETGLGAVNVQPLVYRLACLNGMVVNDASTRTRRNHVGRVNSTEENFALYSQETLEQDGKAFMMKLQDTVRAAVDEARFAKVLDTMRKSTEAKLDTTDIPALVKLTGSNFSLTDAEGKGVLQHLLEGADYTLYGLANAVTRYSQDVESYERATELETIGYSVMTMSPAMLRQINQASAMAA